MDPPNAVANVGQSTPERFPAPHRLAMIASSTVAVSRIHTFAELSIALTPMPTMMRRTPRTDPRADERKKTTKAVAIPPISAPDMTAIDPPPRMSMTISAPVYEPVWKPITSGEPRGFAVRFWRIAPLKASAVPSRIAIAMRGARHSSTTMLVYSSPRPTSAASASGSVMSADPENAAYRASRIVVAQSAAHRRAERASTSMSGRSARPILCTRRPKSREVMRHISATRKRRTI